MSDKKVLYDSIMEQLERVDSNPTSKYMGSAKMSVHSIVAEIFNKFVHMNPNHVVFRDRISQKGVTESTLCYEKEVVEWLKQIYNANEYEGEIVSGGTESNITGLWIGREYLHKKHKVKPIVYITPLTHYSIKKAVNLLDLSFVEIPFTDEFSIDVHKLKTTIIENNIPAIVIGTIGYTSTGSSDNILEISAILNETRIEKSIDSYLHVDAAIGGLCNPFLSSEPLDFSEVSIDSFGVDFHKCGFMYYGAGLFICRKGLPNLVAMPVPYVPFVSDSSLLSSRSGIIALSCWGIIQLTTLNSWKDIFHSCKKLRDILIDKIVTFNIGKIISASDDSISFLVEFYKKHSESIKIIENIYQLIGFSFTNYDGSEHWCHRVYINNNITYKDIENFIGVFNNEK